MPEVWKAPYSTDKDCCDFCGYYHLNRGTVDDSEWMCDDCVDKDVEFYDNPNQLKEM